MLNTITRALPADSKTPSEPANTARAFWGAVALVVLALLVYRPVLPGSFIMDDRRLIESDNPLVNGQLSLSSIWFQTDFPLSDVALWAQWQLWGSHPGWYHAVNIALHSLGAILLWQVLARLRISGAWLAGALFAVHPVCVNSVARIAEIKNTLSLPFFFLSLWFYFSNRPFRHSLSLILFVLALLAKTSTIMLPVALLAILAWRNDRLTARDWLETAPFFFLSLLFGMMSAWFQKHQAMTGPGPPAESFAERAAMAGRIYWFYLGKVFWPANLNLVYPSWKIDAASPMTYIPLLLIPGAGSVCWRFRNGWGRHVLLGLGIFAITLFPALGFFDSQFLTKWRVSDHLQYLPMIAPVALLAAGFSTRRPALIFRSAAAVVIVMLSFLSFHRARIFASEESLFQDTLAKNPAAWGIENDLGVLMAQRGDLESAAAHFRASLKIHPANPDALSNLGLALASEGRFSEAESNYQASLKLRPDDFETRQRFAHALLEEHRVAAGMDQMRLALAVSPKPEIRTRLDYTTLLHQTGHLRESMAELRHVLALQPDSVEALNNLAWLMATAPDPALRDGTGAIKLAEQASRLPPVSNLCVPGTLAAAYAEAGQFSNAVATAEKAIQEENAAGQTRFAAINEQLLNLYRAGRPFHEPAPSDQSQE